MNQRLVNVKIPSILLLSREKKIPKLQRISLNSNFYI